ncbi:MAG TPA: rhodanese-like domain-containing protein [Thermoanaerobaculia bacterium]|nr:rhodanese-like domain-containing protein [Thermoanaerobaculia bacterium]
MRKTVVLAVVCTLIAAIAAAQYKANAPTAPPTAKPAAGTPSPIVVSGARTANQTSFPRISQADALKLYKEGKAVFIDVRSNQQFAMQHIKGAISIPGSQIVKRFSEVPRLKTVITYCACSAEQSSGRAAADLAAHGVKNVWALKGGIIEWKAQGGPIATGPK